MRRRAFTLLELLVATAVLSMLGAALIVILRGGLTTWRRGEARRDSFDAAEAVLGQLRQDLLGLVPPHDSPLRGGGPVEQRLLCDRDPGTGFIRLFLVTTIKGESESQITGLAGNSIRARGVLDYRGDLEEARYDQLRATGGEMEVAWVLAPGGLLYRGIRAPIGPPHSLFSDQDPYALTAGPAGEAASDVDAPSLLRPFAQDVIHLELRFWTQYTTSWDLAQPCRRVLHDEDEESGPLNYWDSTRGILVPPDDIAKDPELFHTFRGRGSLADPRDDLFPAKVQITLVLREAPAAESSTSLAAPLDESETQRFYVEQPGRLARDGGFVLIGSEWIEYEQVVGAEVRIKQRGARETYPATHERMDEVVVGRTFETVVHVPACREDWSEPPLEVR